MKVSARLLTVVLAMALLGGASTGWAQDAEGQPPNIVFVLVDDLGWADLGVYGNTFNETPHIDGFAEQAVRFTDAYAAPVCSPSRGALLSGQDTARTGLTNFIPGHWRPFERVVEPVNRQQHLPLELTTIPESLGEVGYATAHFGKWHLGGGNHRPEGQGFDEAIVTGGRHFAPHFNTRPNVEVENGTPLVDFLTDRAINFMSEHQDQPFFIHLSHYAVHIPIDTTESLFAKYRDKPAADGYPSNPYYAGMLEQVDDSFGRLLDAIDEQGLAENTIVVFYSDNGGLRRRYDVVDDPDAQVVSDNSPLRDEKGSLYEGGIRVPMMIRWPGVTSGGAVCEEPVIGTDFHPTFIEIADAPTPEQPLDGKSLVPLLREPEAGLDREAVYMHYPHYHHSRPGTMVREGDWKLIEFLDNNKLELYNLADDIGERENLVAEHPDRAERMWRMLESWRTERDAAMPRPNPKFDPDRRYEWFSRRNEQPVNTEGMDNHFKPRRY